MFCFLFCCTRSTESDRFGVIFSDKTFETLLKAPSELINYEIPTQTKTLNGGSTGNGAFAACCNSLSSIVFLENNNIQEIGKFCFEKCVKLTKVDMSTCMKLTKLSNSVFTSCSSLESVILPPNLETIAAGVFRLCTKITHFDFPSSLKYIEDYDNRYYGAFEACYKLSSVDWGASPTIKKIGAYAFVFDGLTSIRIPASVESLSSSAFSNTKLEKITIDSGNNYYATDGECVMDINKKIFYFGVFVRKEIYYIPEGITTLSSSCLRGSKFKTVVVPESVKYINGEAFMESALTNITIPKSVTQISDRIFQYSQHLKTIEIFCQTPSIPNHFFDGCSSLQEFRVPNGTTAIGQKAFSGCTSILTIYIPKTVSTIGSGSFYNINPSCEIIFEDLSPMKYENGVIYSFDFSKIIACTDLSKKNITIKDSVVTIGMESFKDIPIVEIKFSNSSQLKYLEESAFSSCSIATLILPPNLKKINKKSFEKCPIQALDISKCVQLNVIEEKAFESSQISILELPPEITTLGDLAFANIKRLSYVTLNEKLEIIGNECFSGSSLISISIPWKLKQLGSRTFSNSLLAHVIFKPKISNPVSKIIGKECFKDCTKLTRVQLVEDIVELGELSFENCFELEEIILVSSVTKIGIQCFKGCTKLSKFVIPDDSSLEEIGEFAFQDCSKLSKFELNETNSKFKFENGILYDIAQTIIFLFLPPSGYLDITIPDSVTNIKACAFQNAVSIERVDMSNSNVERIGYKCFKDCTALSNVRLSFCINSIGNEAFLNCNLQCGGINFFDFDSIENDLIKQLKESGVTDIAFSPCPTFTFTIKTELTALNPTSLIAMVIYSKN